MPRQPEEATQLEDYFPASLAILVMVVLTTGILAAHGCVNKEFFHLSLSLGKSALLSWVAVLAHAFVCFMCLCEGDKFIPFFRPNKRIKESTGIHLRPWTRVPGAVKELVVGMLEVFALTVLMLKTGGGSISPFAPFYPAFPVVLGIVLTRRWVAMLVFFMTAVSFTVSLRAAPIAVNHPEGFGWTAQIVFWGTLLVAAWQTWYDFQEADEAAPAADAPGQKGDPVVS